MSNYADANHTHANKPEPMTAEQAKLAARELECMRLRAELIRLQMVIADYRAALETAREELQEYKRENKPTTD